MNYYKVIIIFLNASLASKSFTRTHIYIYAYILPTYNSHISKFFNAVNCPANVAPFFFNKKCLIYQKKKHII